MVWCDLVSMRFGSLNGSLIRFANKLNQMLSFFLSFFFILSFFFFWGGGGGGGVLSQRSHGETPCSREGHSVFFLLHRLGHQWGGSLIFLYT